MFYRNDKIEHKVTQSLALKKAFWGGLLSLISTVSFIWQRILMQLTLVAIVNTKKKKDKGLELWIWHQVFWSKKRNPLGLGTGKVKKSRQDNLYIAKCCKDKVLPGTKILPKDDGFGHPWCPVETSQLQLADVASRLRTLGKSFHPSSHQFLFKNKQTTKTLFILAFATKISLRSFLSQTLQSMFFLANLAGFYFFFTQIGWAYYVMLPRIDFSYCSLPSVIYTLV